MLWMTWILQFFKKTETELVKKEDYEAYYTVLPQYVVSITLEKKIQANKRRSQRWGKSPIIVQSFII